VQSQEGPEATISQCSAGHMIEEAAASGGVLQTHAGANQVTSGEFEGKHTDWQSF